VRYHGLVRWIVLVVVLFGAACGGSADPGHVPSITTRCAADGDCTVVVRSCCGRCGTDSNTIAVRAERTVAYRQRVCGGDTACDACISEPDPSHVAVCTDGHCAVSVR
jgi:hypothetical protein